MATTVLGLKTFTASDPVDYNEINDNYNKIDSGVKTALQGRAAYNLLDNSDFRNPVNQRGKTSYSASGYTIDRWFLYDPNGDGTVTINNGYISLTGGSGAVSLSCRFPKGFLDANKTYTARICDNLGNISPTPLNFYGSFDAFEFSAGAGETKNIVWAALYEGSYTADTLPAYQPKGYAAELAECQLYYLPLNHQLLGSGYTFNGGAALLVPRKMRIDAPSFVASGTIIARVNGADYPLTLSSVTTYGSMIKVDFASNTIPVNYPCAFYSDAPGVSLNADL